MRRRELMLKSAKQMAGARRRWLLLFVYSEVSGLDLHNPGAPSAPPPPPPPPQFRQPSCVRFTPVSLFRRICNLRRVYRSMVALQVGAVLLAAVPMETRVSGIAQYLQRRSSWEKQVYPDARLGSVPLVPCHSHT